MIKEPFDPSIHEEQSNWRPDLADLYFPDETANQHEKETVRPFEVWIVDDNAPGYSQLFKSISKGIPGLRSEAISNFDNAYSLLCSRHKEGKQMPDLIFLGNDYREAKRRLEPSRSRFQNTFNPKESANKLQAQIEQSGIPNLPPIVNFTEQEYALSGDFMDTINKTILERDQKDQPSGYSIDQLHGQN